MRKILIFCVLFILCISFASSKIVTITAADGSGKDKYCQGTCSNTDELVFTNNPLSFVYIQFDLTSLPDNTQITSAYLYLKFKEDSSEISNYARVYPVNSPWQEGDDQQPGHGLIIGNLNDINCGQRCNNEDGWVGVEGSGLVSSINSMLRSTNNGFIVKESNDDFKVYSSEATEGIPFLYLEYSAECYDLDNDNFTFGDCNVSNDCNDTNYYVNPAANETCNYIDDDCNEAIDDTGYPCLECNESNGFICNSSMYCRDEYLDVLDSDVCCPEECRDTCIEGTREPCGNDTGECIIGYYECHNNEWSVCLDEVPPVKELCNNKDDNCDGIVDNTENYEICGCSNDSSPSIEIYDGIDNDCDENIDENTTCLSRGGTSCSVGEACPGILLDGTEVNICCSLPCSRDCTTGESKSCGIGIGACREGLIKCVDGKWGECIGSVGPLSETCNRIDDDCDGTIDDVEVIQSCQCYDDGKPFEELCNQADDNCDGTIDESCTFVSEACSDGILNFNEVRTDCGGACEECDGGKSDASSLGPDDGTGADDLTVGKNPDARPSGTDTTTSKKGSSTSKFLIYFLILISFIVIGFVIYTIYDKPKNEPGFIPQKQKKSPFKKDEFFIPKKKPVVDIPEEKIDRYDAILRMKPKTSKSAKNIKKKIDEKF